MHVDQDAKRRAKAEVRSKTHSFTLDGQSYELPARCPLEVLDLMAEGQFRAAFTALFRGDQELVARFFAADPPPDDEDLEDIMSVYGSPGESSASRRSSTSTGRPSKRTS